MSIFKTPAPREEHIDAMAHTERVAHPAYMIGPKLLGHPLESVKTAQSFDEVQGNLSVGSRGDGGTRSVVHAERPRRGHNV